MKKFKKIIVGAMLVMALGTFTACGNNDDNVNDTTDTQDNVTDDAANDKTTGSNKNNNNNNKKNNSNNAKNNQTTQNNPTDTKKKEQSVTAPKTGDTSDMTLWTTLLIVSFAGAAGIVVRRNNKTCK